MENCDDSLNDFAIEEIRTHVRHMFEYYGEDMGYFEEYMVGVLEHPLQAALECFRDLVKYIPINGKRNKYVQKSSKVEGTTKNSIMESVGENPKTAIFKKSKNVGTSCYSKTTRKPTGSSRRRFYAKYLPSARGKVK